MYKIVKLYSYDFLYDVYEKCWYGWKVLGHFSSPSDVDDAELIDRAKTITHPRTVFYEA